jgi:hypothetical protein
LPGERQSQKPRRLKIDHVVDICENAFSFDSSLLIGADIEIIGSLMKENNLLF